MESQTLPWELFDMFEKTQIKNCYRKVFHQGQSSLLREGFHKKRGKVWSFAIP